MGEYEQMRREHDVQAYGIDGTESGWSDNPLENGIEIGADPICTDCQQIAENGKSCKCCDGYFCASHLDAQGNCEECRDELARQNHKWDGIELGGQYHNQVGFLEAVIETALRELRSSDVGAAIEDLEYALAKVGADQKAHLARLEEKVRSCR